MKNPCRLAAAAALLLALLPAAALAAATPGTVDREALKDFKIAPDILTLATQQKLNFTGKNSLQNGPQRQAYGLYVDALVTAISPDAKTADGKPVADILLEQVRAIIAPGHEPNAACGLDGWTHSAVAQALLLVKKTPEVWARLKPDEIERIDWIMKAMAIAGHFGYDDQNNYNTDLHADDNSSKNWNPNHRLYLFVVLSAAEYFGPQQLNDIYKSFDYDQYIKKFDELGFTNIKAVWTCYDWKPILEHGGPYISPKSKKKLGDGTGVKHDFVYKKMPLADISDIFAVAEEVNYSDKVTNGIAGKSWILDHGSSPFLGQMGMMAEFNSHDAEGVRSSLGYCEEDFCPYTLMYTTMKVLNLLPADSQRCREIEQRIYVGNEDFLYKNKMGFHSFQHGKGKDTHVGTEKWLAYPFVLEIWNDYLKPRLQPEAQKAGQ